MAFKSTDTCFQKAAKDEPIFTLRAKDRLAPEIVDQWATRALLHGTPADKVEEARQCAIAMREWQKANGSKIPD